MHVKTLTGPSIHALLAEARTRFGDDVVLLESEPARGDRPARITVMTDRLPPASEAPPAREEPALALVADTGLAEVAAGGASTPGEPVRAAGYGYRKRPLHRTETTRAELSPEAVPEPPRTPGRDRLFVPPAPTASTDAGGTDRVAARLDRLEERLAAFEHRLGNALIGMSQPWMGLPVYGRLLAAGLRTRTLTRLFERLSRDGFGPDEDPARLQWAVAHRLREMLNVPSPRTCDGTQLFIGPSGAGKTALQIKLAKNPRFLGRHQTSVIVIRPEEETDLCYQNPVELYRRFDLPTQTVASPAEMEAAMERARRFAYVLIDTPPMPLRLPEARRFLERLIHITAPITPLQVHLVLNAAGLLDGFTPDFLGRLPLHPDTLALTHLDEAGTLGHVAECLMALQLPVQFTTDGPGALDHIRSYSATWFVEELLGLRIVERDTAPAAWSLL
ncbi:flagellar biosynthesis protein FlhF [Rhodocaloribacter litoris]|uniref:flagellar biosynthesis protein FlhF n=1 Tax=Rhodocaloribacter litoris TaxID=2558931 RepID=UPI0014224751|nr:flagellar biosynthesis protein FlhF [Rhodocaloribacter litoris]QXD16068.1 flagellar biosynthesis protein FlhF [Rhodocaloribacter litoris]